MTRISIKDAAKMMGVHENTIRKYIEKDILTGYQIVKNGKISVSKEQVERLMGAEKQGRQL